MNKFFLIVGLIVTTTLFSGCRQVERIIYPTKRSYNFNHVVDKIVEDLDRRDNKDLASYYAADVREKYGKSRIVEELKNAERGLGKIESYRTKEGGKSGHRGGLGETVICRELTIQTNSGEYHVYINWNEGDNSGGDQRLRETEGIERIGIYPEKMDKFDTKEQFADVNFPVQYPAKE